MGRGAARGPALLPQQEERAGRARKALTNISLLTPGLKALGEHQAGSRCGVFRMGVRPIKSGLTLPARIGETKRAPLPTP
jgi:hypothetical protein